MDGRNVVSTVYGFVVVDCAELVMAEVPLVDIDDDVTINFDAFLVDGFDDTGNIVDCIAVLFVVNMLDAVDDTDILFDRVVLMVDVPLVVPDVALVDVGVFVVEDFVDNFDIVVVIMVDVELFVVDNFVVDGLIVDVACSVVDMVDGVLDRVVLMDEVPLVDLDVIVVDVNDFVVDDFVVTVEVVDWLDGLAVDADCVVVEMVDDVLGRVVFIVDVPLVDPDFIMVVVKVFVVDGIVVMVGVVD